MNNISLSWKLLLILMMFFLFPILGWIGFSIADKEIERVKIIENNNQLNLYGNYFQQLLNNDKGFRDSLGKDEPLKSVSISSKKGPILIDGYSDEWFPYKKNRLEAYNSKNISYLYFTEDERFFYGMVEVRDNDLVYSKGPNLSGSSDMLRIDFGRGYWLFKAVAPGKINVLQESGSGFKPINSIYAIWQETLQGYNIEFRAPKSLIGDSVNAVMYDSDDKSAASYVDQYQGVFSFTQLSTFAIKRENTIHWLGSNELEGQRITIINLQGDVIHRIGTLFVENDYLLINNANINQKDEYKNNFKLNNHLTQVAFKSGAGAELDNVGEDFFISRNAKVVYQDNKALALVILESSAIEEKKLIKIVFYIGAILFIVTWLMITYLVISQARKFRKRIDKLREITEDAYEQDLGSVDFRHLKLEGDDEVSQLYNSIYYFNERLDQRRDHQQKLLSRLNHELRTPLAIIGSSIDNLALSDLQLDDQQLLKYARSGVERLSLSLSRLSEANRLEQSIDEASTEWFELNPLLTSLIESYRNNWQGHRFQLKMLTETIKIKGAEDLFAQMLDKIISNAVDFNDKKRPIIVTLKSEKGHLNLFIANSGPTIKNEQLKSVFDLMESYRSNARVGGSKVNLGLGLYMAHIIAKKHRAKVSAHNSALKDGVIIKLDWNKNNYVVS